MSQGKAQGVTEFALKRTDEGKLLVSRNFGTAWRWVVSLLACSMSLYHLWVGASGLPEVMVHRPVHLAFILVLAFLTIPPFRLSAPSRRWFYLDLLLCLFTILATAHFFVAFHRINWRMPYVDPLTLNDFLFGGIIVLLTLEVTRRTVGWPMVILAIVFILYALFGDYVPGTLAHRGVSLRLLLDHLYLTPEGIYGLAIGVSSTYVILFIIFSAFLDVSGTGQFFLNFAQGLFGGVRGGPAKISVVASGLFGTISGSAVANVMVDGWLTIPLMRRVGFRPHIAAAIEAVASTGGQLMPPVMASAAFLIAEILGMTYLEVCIAAALPAVLYYSALFVMVDIEAAKTGLRGLSKSELPSAWKTLKEGWYLLISPAALIYFLAILEWTALKSAFWSIIVAIAASAIRRATRMGWKKIIDGLSKGAMNMLQVGATCACAGIIIGVFSLTGLGSKFSSFLIYLSGGNLAFLLVLTMIASLILGMGLPTLPCYLVLAIIVAPSLVEMGVMPIAAHLFIFYFGIISAITPPVALAAYAAAGVGETDPMRTGYAAWRLGLCAFLLPFMFVYGPVLLMKGSVLRIILATISGLFGVTALAAAVQGYFFRTTNLWERVALFAAAVLLIDPGLLTDLIGYVIIFAIITLQGGWQKLGQWARRRVLLRGPEISPQKEKG